MIKNLAGLECKIENEIIKVICGSQCPLTHLKEAMFQFLKHIGQIEDAARQAEENKKNEEAQVQIEEPKPE